MTLLAITGQEPPCSVSVDARIRTFLEARIPLDLQAQTPIESLLNPNIALFVCDPIEPQIQYIKCSGSARRGSVQQCAQYFFDEPR
ncbi:MAG: hypothetical protein ACI8T1_002271 [Verrucomicrobiales bacterium]|jgi:hypothetical protein